MKICLTCPQCGEKEWSEITDGRTLETYFQCKHCNTKAQPEEMCACTVRDSSPVSLPKETPKIGKYYILEKYNPQDKVWYFEACYNATNLHDLNAMVLAAYELGRFKCCGEKGQCVRIVTSNEPVSCFSPAGYPKHK